MTARVPQRRHLAASPHGSAPEVAVRTARPCDLDAMEALEQAAFTADRMSRRSLRRLLTAPTAMVLVAERDDRVAGAAVVLVRGGSSRARLYSIAVDPAARGHGIGRRLLAAAEDAAAARGRDALRLEVRADNAGAVALYRNAGYHPIGRYPAYYADRTDALRFEKALARPATPAR